jgi:glycosyltransferase involved in cell wall biosynthesis
MAVNNYGSDDVRVVKSAEQTVKNKNHCYVLCLSKSNENIHEIINGVHYYRLKLRYGVLGLWFGFFPDHIKKLSKVLKSPKFKTKKLNNDKESIIKDGHLLPKKFSNGYFLILEKCIRFILKNALIHTLIMNFRQGAYLRTFYPFLKNNKADILYAHELPILESIVLASESNKSFVIYDSHELEVDRNHSWPKKSFRKYSSKEGKYIKYVDKVIAVSDGIAMFMSDYYKIDKILVVKNTPLLSQQKESKNHIRDEINLDKKIPLIVYIGSVTFNRGIEEILTVLEKLKSFHFACVGPVNYILLEKLKDISTSLNIADRVHFIKPKKPSLLTSFISDADISIVPIQNTCKSYYYCLPNKIFESIYAGLPILGSNLYDIRKLIKKEKLGEICNMDDTQSILKGIKLVYGNKNYFNKNKVKKLREKYSFENEFNKVIKLYESLT